MSSRHYLSYLSLSKTKEELYNNIVEGFYSHAVRICENISDDKGNVISDAVARLALEGNQNLLNFSYKLWHSEHKDIVTKHFPKTYGAIFNEDDVTLVNKKFNLALKLDRNTNNVGEKQAWGDANDKSTSRVAWKLVAVWENNKVLFKFKNQDINMFLKVDLLPDSVNDRKVLGSVGDSELRNLWSLKPIVLNGQHYFYIISKQFSQGLKLAESEDHLGDRRLWCHNGDVEKDPLRFAWEIKKL